MARASLTLMAVLALALAACGQASAPAPQAEAPAAAEPAVQAAAAADESAAPAEAVAAAVQEQQARFEAAAAEPAPAARNTAYQFEFPGLMVDRVPLNAFRGEVVLVVNTASRCGLTPQYTGLQEIYTDYHDRGFEIVGVPSNNFGGQEPGSAEEIRDFCRLNYGVTFPMAAKTEVIGDNAHPFYQWAEAQLGAAAVPRWNFHKLLIGRDGRLIAAFPSAVTPTSEQVRNAISAALGS